MKRLLSALVLCVIARGLRGEAFTLRVGEQATIDIIGVTAAYAIDQTIVDVALPQSGRILLTGKSTGSTQIIAVTPTTTNAYLITVGPAKSFTGPQPNAEGPAGRYAVRYTSEAGQLQNAFDVFMRDGERQSEIHLINVHYFRDTLGQARTSFPFASYHVKTPRREFTLLDDYVNVSPLTIPNTQVRGMHWLERGLELHAGYATPSMYEGLFLPVDRRWVAGAGYSIRSGPWRWTPNVYSFFSQPPNTSARRGTVFSLISEYRPDDNFFARGEVAEGNSSFGGSTEARFDGERDHAHGRVVYKPRGFPTLGIFDLPGLHSDALWDRRASDRLTISASSTYDRSQFLTISQRTEFGTLGVRYSITKPLLFLTGAEYTDVRISSTEIRSVAIPVGLTYDLRRFGAGVIYRLIQNAGASRHGDSLRLSARVGGPAMQISGWVERQRQSPTLDLIFQEEPNLESALLRLGITVRSPEDLARVLRDNAVLINLGFIEGVTVNLAPRQTLGGLDFNWLSPWESRDRVSFHSIYDRVEGIHDVRDTFISTLTYSRRLVGSTDAYGSVTRWRLGIGALKTERTSYEVGLNTSLSGIATLFQRGGPIEGFVFLDPQMNGTFTDGATPMQGVAVSLDGVDSARSDSSGHYVFRGVPAGVHRVAAQLPPSKPAFFTTPSHAEVPAGSRVDFGLVYSQARLSGRVVSDANVGIGGAVVTVTPKSGAPLRTTADPEGTFRLDLPAGDYRADLATESLPPGYVVTGETQRSVHLIADQPLMLNFVVRALRSIAGVTTPGAEIEIVPLGKKTVADATGSFVLRSLPAGTFKLTSRSGAQSATKMVVLPDLPASMHDVNLILTGKPAPAPAMVASAPTGAFHLPIGAFRLPQNAEAARARLENLGLPAEVRQSGSLQVVTSGPFATRDDMERAAAQLRGGGTGGFAVQVGAFRDASNAEELLRRLRRLGMTVFTSISHGLTLVRVGPFATREAATAAATQLRQAQFEAVVTPR